MSAAVNERAFSEVKRLCCAGLEGHELLHAVTGRLRRAVPFEAYCASTMDPASGLITHALAAETFGEKEAAIFFDHLYFEHDMSPFERMTQDRRPVELLSESTGGKLERSPRYRELIGPTGFGHEARIILTAGGARWGSMDLTREAGRPTSSPARSRSSAVSPRTWVSASKRRRSVRRPLSRRMASTPRAS